MRPGWKSDRPQTVAFGRDSLGMLRDFAYMIIKSDEWLIQNSRLAIKRDQLRCYLSVLEDLWPTCLRNLPVWPV